MHKVGVLMMGRMSESSPKKVKEIILEVQGKTKMSNIAEYLLEMEKIKDTQVEFSLEKNGRPVSDSSNITQTLKYTKVTNGVLKLYLYEKGQFLNLNVSNSQLMKQSEEVKKSPPKVEKHKEQTQIRYVEEEVETKGGFCCC